MRKRGVDLERLQGDDELVVLDAEMLLSDFMVDGMPDARRFRRTMTPLLERVTKGRTGCVVRAHGEMVDVLWKAGQTVAAIRLETLWNELARTHTIPDGALHVRTN